MAKFIAVSGPSATGKTSIIEELKNAPELEDAVFVSDIFDTVWQDLIERGIFHDYDDISGDTEFLCVFLLKVIEYYNMYLDDYKDEDTLVVFDCCWVDLAIYANLNMWYLSPIKEVQETIFGDLSKYDDRISKVFITNYDEGLQSKDKHSIPYKRSNIKYNRGLELKYYRLAGHLKQSEVLPSSDVQECVDFIINNL